MNYNNYYILKIFCAIMIGTCFYRSEVPSDSYFIDKDVQNHQQLTDRIVNHSETEVFELFSHGRSGELLINESWLNAEQISQWISLSPEVNTLNIYGCEFAKGEKGMQAVAYLEKTLGVKVNASTNLTGKDGDWYLEIGGVNIDFFNTYAFNLQCSNQGQVLNQDYDCDGINNFNDNDDDNDGILDDNECSQLLTVTWETLGFTDAGISAAGGQTINNIGGILGIPSLVGVSMKIEFIATGVTTNSSNLVSSGSPFISIANDVNGSREFKVTLSSPVEKMILSYDPQFTDGERVTFSSTPVGTLTNPTGSVTGLTITANSITNPVDGNNDVFFTQPQASYESLNSRNISMTSTILSGGTSTNSQNGNTLRILYRDCDLDGDGISNHFDLDSDGDGCSDAKEGAGAILNANLVNSSLPGGNSGSSYTGTYQLPVIKNLGNTVSTIGVPTIVGTGQGAGDSRNINVKNQCFCYKTGVSGAGLTSINGISALNREIPSTAITTTWPAKVNNGLLVLDSKEKGFVITRMADPETTLGTNAVEGMLVYDTDNNCLKMYNGTSWACLIQSCVDN